MNENFGKPARTGVWLRHATRTEELSNNKYPIVAGVSNYQVGN
ncbi:hypothetical protein B6N60_00594 [Richelia sinica FACHB-800]|uniref:Uncharacterized protein n=1 Tax=Richelia sinica FACHB-800 TaxID=1357546 RepID=A0A975Y396_9NOST|nr:hypothetical protein [Richelia sinica]QXE21916.1 hypothetical protein B6N60_00594 [Richelia sinica FACHB-800]